MYPYPVSGEFGIIPNATNLSSKAYLIPAFKVSIKILLFFISWSDAKTINIGSKFFSNAFKAATVIAGAVLRPIGSNKIENSFIFILFAQQQ